MKKVICQCGAEVEYLEGRSTKCRICGVEQGKWDYTHRSIPHVVGSFSPAMHVASTRGGLGVVATRDLQKGEVVERAPALWIGDFASCLQIKGISVSHPVKRGQNVPLGRYCFSAPLTDQCRIENNQFVCDAPPETWSGRAIPFGNGAMYNHAEKGTANLIWHLEFVGYRLFYTFTCLKDIPAGVELRHNYGYRLPKDPIRPPLGYLK